MRKSMLVGVAVALATVTTASAANASSGLMYVTTNTVLNEDHYGSILVSADNVTLDCAGHSVIAPAEGADYGIEIDYQTGVTVKNCLVTGFRVDGVRLLGASHNLLTGNTANANGTNGNTEASGFLIDSDSVSNADDNVLRRNVANGNQGGGFLVHGHGNPVTGTLFDKNIANHNIWFGFGAWRTSSSTWSNNVANNSGHWGFAFFEECGNNTIDQNVARSSGEFDAYDLTALNNWTNNNFGTTSPAGLG